MTPLAVADASPAGPDAVRGAGSPSVPNWLGTAWQTVAVQKPNKLVGLWVWNITPAQQDALLTARDAGLAITVQRKEADGRFVLLAAVSRKASRGSPHYEFGFASRADDPPREAPPMPPAAPARAGSRVQTTPARVEWRTVKRPTSRNMARWSELRRDVLSRMYPADVPGPVILRHVNALPGEAVTLAQLQSFANYRGLRRPVANDRGYVTVSVAVVEVYAEAMQVPFDGKSLRDVNVSRGQSKRPPFIVPWRGR